MPKPGRKSGPITEHARLYESDGLKRGLTVAEWEKEKGLPQFSVYPEAAKATEMRMKGYFMYRDATPEERAIMNKGMFMKIKKNYGDLEAIAEERRKKNEKARIRWAERKAHEQSECPEGPPTEGREEGEGW